MCFTERRAFITDHWAMNEVYHIFGYKYIQAGRQTLKFIPKSLSNMYTEVPGIHKALIYVRGYKLIRQSLCHSRS